MTTHIVRRGGIVTGLVLALSFASPALAAPPYTVNYAGTPVTAAVPGKPFMLNFKVTNTGTTVYSGVKVIFHLPDELESSKVAPADARIEDNTITWMNVPIAAGKAFYPSFTFTIKSGTPLTTKVSIWVEVTGSGMEATSTNFSVIARSTASTKTTSTLTSADITAMFQSVYGRTSTASELKYWLGRRTDKPGRTALLGAMGYHQAQGITH